MKIYFLISDYWTQNIISNSLSIVHNLDEKTIKVFSKWNKVPNTDVLMQNMISYYSFCFKTQNDMLFSAKNCLQEKKQTTQGLQVFQVKAIG